MTTIDRLLFRAYLKAYLICVVSLLALYIIIDLFTNLDDFAQAGVGLASSVAHIANYYAYQAIQIFDRLCEAIVLLAGMFTIAWMQRSNELMPMLAAGVPTHRVIRPILVGSALMMTLGSLNQEYVMPRVADRITAERGDTTGEKQLEVRGAFDRNGVHMEGLVAYRQNQSARFLYVTIPQTSENELAHLTAERARYVPPEPEAKQPGGWLLTGTTPREIDGWSNTEIMELIDPGKYFLHTEDITFDAVTRNRNWYSLLSTTELYEMLEDPEAGGRLTRVAVVFHMRLTRFPVGMTLVIMGLGLILRNQNLHVFISAGLCLGMCLLFYAVIFLFKYLGDADLIAPALAAWMPVIIFGPVALALYDGMQT